MFILYAPSYAELNGSFLNRLDYLGIATLVIGSSVALIYYSFYCYTVPLIIYETVAVVLGVGAGIVSLFDKFSETKYRTLRAGMLHNIFTQQRPLIK